MTALRGWSLKQKTSNPLPRKLPPQPKLWRDRTAWQALNPPHLRFGKLQTPNLKLIFRAAFLFDHLILRVVWSLELGIWEFLPCPRLTETQLQKFSRQFDRA